MDFRTNLRRLREAARLTQEQLAHACGWAGQSRIANYEADPSKKNSREPTLSEITQLAHALGVSEAELLGLTTGHVLAAPEARLIEIYRAADVDGKRVMEQTSEMVARAGTVKLSTQRKAS